MQTHTHTHTRTHTHSQAIPLLKKSIHKAYIKKGQHIVDMNYAAVDAALDKLVPIAIPEGWRLGEVCACVCCRSCVVLKARECCGCPGQAGAPS